MLNLGGRVLWWAGGRAVSWVRSLLRPCAARTARNGVGDPRNVARLAGELKTLRAEVNRLREQRNSIAAAAVSKEEKAERGKAIRKQVAELEGRLDTVTEAVMDEALHLPNLTHPDVPAGPEPNAVTVRTVGERPAGPVPDHLAVGALPWGDRTARLPPLSLSPCALSTPPHPPHTHTHTHTRTHTDAIALSLTAAR